MRTSDAVRRPVRSRRPAAATRLGRLAAAALLTLTLAGCFNPFRPKVTSDPGIVAASPAPRPTSPRNAMKLFRWCWENQNITKYEELLTDDFRFASAVADTEGNVGGDDDIDRSDELENTGHIFVGGSATTPPANSINLTYLTPLIPRPDTRPGRPAPWWITFQTDVDLTIRTDQLVYRIISNAVFYTVRGDTANIPPQFRARFGKNRRLWFLERYEETGVAAVVYEPVGSLRAGERPAFPASVRLLRVLAPREPARAKMRGEDLELQALELRLAWSQLKRHYRR